MEPTFLLYVISPMVVLTTVSAIAFYYLSGMKQVNEYEKELKELRHQVIKGNLGHKAFRYMKDNLRVDDLYTTELKRLDDMFQQNILDVVTYDRMKKAYTNYFQRKISKNTR